MRPRGSGVEHLPKNLHSFSLVTGHSMPRTKSPLTVYTCMRELSSYEKCQTAECPPIVLQKQQKQVWLLHPVSSHLAICRSSSASSILSAASALFVVSASGSSSAHLSTGLGCDPNCGKGGGNLSLGCSSLLLETERKIEMRLPSSNCWRYK